MLTHGLQKFNAINRNWDIEISTFSYNLSITRAEFLSIAIIQYIFNEIERIFPLILGSSAYARFPPL